MFGGLTINPITDLYIHPTGIVTTDPKLVSPRFRFSGTIQTSGRKDGWPVELELAQCHNGWTVTAKINGRNYPAKDSPDGSMRMAIQEVLYSLLEMKG